MKPPESLELEFKNGELQVVGTANYQWYQRLVNSPLSLLGVTDTRFSSLQVEEINQKVVDRYLSDLASVSVDFEVGRSDLDDSKIPKLFYLAARVRKLQGVLVPERQVLNIRITGSTDSLGTDAENRKLGLARAENVAQYLSNQGVSLSNLKTDFHLSQAQQSDDQARRIIVEAWVENPTIESLNRRLSETAAESGL